MNPRLVFTDGWNSLAHVVLGAATAVEPIFVIPFLFYQMVIHVDGNTPVDLCEFAIGCTLTAIYLKGQ